LSRVADLYAKRTAGGRNAEVLIAETTDQVERFLDGLFLRESERVRLDLRLDGGSHLRRCTKESIRGDASLDSLMRSLEVVVLDEECEAPKTVREVGKDGLTKKLLPERLPEAFDLPERLRMLRPALAVCDAASSK
jgi:hypothetical protein